jgi:hypothetical protein
LPLPFAHMVVRDGRAFDDTPHAANSTAAEQHSFTEDRLAGRGMSDDGKVADIRRGMRRHASNDESDLPLAQALGMERATIIRPSGLPTSIGGVER